VDSSPSTADALVALVSLTLNPSKLANRPAEQGERQPRPSSRVRVTKAARSQIVTLYVEESLSTRQVSAQTGISRSHVLRILKDAGVRMRPAGSTQPPDSSRPARDESPL